ncbi:acyl-CoA thioesterase II [Corallincola spongiicola]|uniref:Acyl-CoA thioesterase II n=1 Tax=Corallincola spongiicola TaxID=2520508 RepID=A0ABY1WRE1_9GAMM|nr:acyl-CoA thioesterase II [Corallincola spongiicola]TAA47292.1 acyl-CoA thioesterase II [Corallincola spongiicola]
MTQVLDQLTSLLTLEEIEAGLYRGQSQDLGFPQVFGGQVIGQALAAAKQTVDISRKVHSFHSYFLLPGDASRPIVYDVEVIRDGRSYSTRRIKAIQYGKPIFYMTASFHQEEAGFDHQTTMPNVASPEQLESQQAFAKRHLHLLPEKIRDQYACEMPIEMRSATPFNPLQPEKMPAVRDVWFRANGTLPDDPRMHMYLLAYASDFNFLPTAAQPHGVSFMQPSIQMATIDHSMWFHRDFRMDDWLLYHVDSPSSGGGRAVVRGQFFDTQGRLVASTMQEGVFRQRKST